MAYAYTLLFIAAALFSLYLLIQLRSFFIRQKMLKLLEKEPFPSRYQKIAVSIPDYGMLSLEDQKKIEHLIMRFIYEKSFLGIEGMQITDEVKVVIAFYASLLLLHIDKHDMYGNLQRIIVYPYEFMLKEERSYDGSRALGRSILEGEAANDTVLLSWHQVKKDAYHHRVGNVVIHEFAHELDFLDGEIDGVPPMSQRRYDAWAKHLFSRYEQLNLRTIKGRYLGKYKLFGSYAATNEAEFFAVATERFFQTPLSLKKKFPQIYEELKRFYCSDPLFWAEKASAK